MSDKIIIEEVLWEKLEEKGIKQPYDTDHEEQLAKVLAHWDASITGDWDDRCNRWFYMESTADSYEVYVATYGSANDISIGENVYYYDSDLASAIMEEIQYNGGSETVLHIDSYLWDDIYMDDQMLEYFGETIDDIIENNEEEGYGLTPVEIQELKEEYGLDAEEIEETVS